jgi:hypothetical protein
VTAIAAPASLKVGFKGDGGHAGAVLMPVRWHYSTSVTHICASGLSLRKKRFGQQGVFMGKEILEP